MFSSFIFLQYLHVSLWIYTILAIGSFYFLFNQKKQVYFFTGFFIGIFWFYWISFSFIYYGFSYALPLGILAIGTIYAFIFLIPALVFKHPFLRMALLVLIVEFIHPFEFNWLEFRLLLLDTPFRVDYIGLILFVIMVYTLTCKRFYKLFFILIFVINIDYSSNETHLLPFDIELVQTNIPQNEKWENKNKTKFINENLSKINKAILQKKQVIIFPESAFALYLNQEPVLVDILKQLSNSITIIAGALTYENHKFYNSTYVFFNEKMEIFHKVKLVPFGEKVPFPKFIRDIINNLLYDGAQDFSTAKKPQDYFIKDVKIRNAICFEASVGELFYDNPKFMIAISNNAWFTPSSEPMLQHLLLKLFASLHNTSIYHSVNGSKSEIITPRVNFFTLTK